MPVPNEWISKENANGGHCPSNEDQGNGLGWEFYDQNWPNQAQGSYMQDSQMQNPQTPILSSYGQVSSPYGLASADYGSALDNYGSVPDSYGLAPDSYGLAPGSYWQTQGPPAGRRPNSPYGIAPQPYQQWDSSRRTPGKRARSPSAHSPSAFADGYRPGSSSCRQESSADTARCIPSKEPASREWSWPARDRYSGTWGSSPCRPLFSHWHTADRGYANETAAAYRAAAAASGPRPIRRTESLHLVFTALENSMSEPDSGASPGRTDPESNHAASPTRASAADVGSGPAPYGRMSILAPCLLARPAGTRYAQRILNPAKGHRGNA